MIFLPTLLAVASAAHGADASVNVSEAQEQSAQSIVDRVVARYKTVDVLRASFVQVTTSTYGKETQSGTVVFKRPRKMRWEFEDEGQQFITDGQTMWVYNPAEKQVIVYKDLSSENVTVDSLLQSLDRLDELYDVAPEVLADGGHRLSLSPKNESDFKSVELHLDAALSLKRVVIVDSFGSKTDMTFSNVDMTTPVDDEAFRFTPPPGVELIDAS